MAKQKRTEELISVRYLDHVIYHRADPLSMKPQVREAVGWLIYECDEYINLFYEHEAEPPNHRGGDPKSSGAVLMKTDILALRRLGIYRQPLQKSSNCHLNSAQPIVRAEYALLPKKRKTQTKKRESQQK